MHNLKTLAQGTKQRSALTRQYQLLLQADNTAAPAAVATSVHHVNRATCSGHFHPSTIPSTTQARRCAQCISEHAEEEGSQEGRKEAKQEQRGAERKTARGRRISQEAFQ